MKTLTATVVTATMAMSAGQTMAAAAAAPAAAAPVTAQDIAQGPPVTGLCVMSVSMVQAGSLYGKAINKQLDIINVQTNAELTKSMEAIKAEATKVESNKATLSELQYQTQMLTAQDKYNTFQATVQQRQRELDETEAQQNKAFSEELQKIAIKVYQDQKCSILIDRDASIMIASPAMDITTAVTKAMDADKSTVPAFGRVALPAAPVAAAGTTRN